LKMARLREHAFVSKPAPINWAQQKERSNRWALTLMRWVAVRAGRRVARWALPPIALYFLITHGKARRACASYWQRVLGHPASVWQLYGHMHHFAATVLDRVYFLQNQFHEFDITATGAEEIDALIASGCGAFMVGAHLGSFEALRAIGEKRGMRVAMLMFEDNARLINATLAAIAPNAQLRTIALGRLGAMLSVRQWLDLGGVAGLLGDRTLPDPSKRSRTQTLPFLGAPAQFSDGPFRLAAMLRRPIIFTTGLYLGEHRYELRFAKIADFSAAAIDSPAGQEARIQEALRNYVSLLESLCRESPRNWFNFFDFWATDEKATDETLF
jgi:predicted LPLAT superfamily acyltransferase